MAELAFEAVIRLAIAVVVLGLILAIANSLFSNVTNRLDIFSSNTSSSQEDVIIKGKVGKDGFIGLFEKCYKMWHENIPRKEEEVCFVVLDIDENALRSAAGSLDYVKVEKHLQDGDNVVIAYRVSEDVVVVK